MRSTRGRADEHDDVGATRGGERAARGGRVVGCAQGKSPAASACSPPSARMRRASAAPVPAGRVTITVAPRKGADIAP